MTNALDLNRVLIRALVLDLDLDLDLVRDLDRGPPRRPAVAESRSDQHGQPVRAGGVRDNPAERQDHDDHHERPDCRRSFDEATTVTECNGPQSYGRARTRRSVPLEGFAAELSLSEQNGKFCA
jgi:hypothetical protein